MTRVVFRMDIEGEGPQLLENIAATWRRLDEWPVSNVSYEFEEKNKLPGHTGNCRCAEGVPVTTLHTVKREKQQRDLSIAP